MTKQELQEFVDELDGKQKHTRFKRLITICTRVFGDPAKSRGRGSHFKFKTPWKGDPRINLQTVKGGKAKAYQVDQVIQALIILQQTTKDEKPTTS